MDYGLGIVGKEDIDIHPDDPTNQVPKNKAEFKQRVLNEPYQPVNINFPRSTFGNWSRNFQKSWYQLYPWSEYSPKTDAAYCFSCQMFNDSIGLNSGQSEIVFSKSGFKNWKQSTTKFNCHQGSKCHLNSTTSLKTATNPNLKSIDTILDEQRENILSQKEIKRLQNREIMKKLIDIVLCLGIGGKPFCGTLKNE